MVTILVEYQREKAKERKVQNQIGLGSNTQNHMVHTLPKHKMTYKPYKSHKKSKENQGQFGELTLVII